MFGAAIFIRQGASRYISSGDVSVWTELKSKQKLIIFTGDKFANALA